MTYLNDLKILKIVQKYFTRHDRCVIIQSSRRDSTGKVRKTGNYKKILGCFQCVDDLKTQNVVWNIKRLIKCVHN